ncbi:class I SAM-dependent methyltransferase [Paraburkholderia sp. D15]|uniref:O-methyltransferase n=1 Tax=Paraburkholderia sp. D15 TaxID=2880218 RepID=UPI0024786E10|nr:class I SAM-dependent methyltransferase [Paraburkholderia sp. D15]WGS50746.1 class I SAM-dependent methyltransferase [Paraburkholderia sp. D15]
MTDSLSNGRVVDTLARLFRQAEEADRPLMEQFTSGNDQAGPTPQSLEDVYAEHIAEEARDIRGFYRGYADNFLNVTPEYGRFLYQCARMRGATRIVEFGTSMGISTIYLAAALRDMGGGELIGTELEPSKAARARANLQSAGLADLVDIREGDARETLAGIDGDVDMVLLDGAFSLYLPVLKLIEPRLKAGAAILAENAIDRGNEYLAYVRDPANGYRSQPLAINEGRGNELSVRTC